ncbi:MAG TPA: hypothetical protein VJ843_05440 [Candidatus Saccharimonadales bacterium]|nr:hypothetical protein [Candidatus Saccharimonadales bacterium]
MENQKQSVVERLQQANNILVTVSSNPSVDQLAACIGLTLALNKLGKHATAVFSGAIPSTIEFLQPEKTLEKNTDSLRDFIIALDKSKADKLRYKVEDKVVKIFITPYRTSITQKDLDFSQGDFNVDVVLALGVHVQADLDQAITAHGRILHDATVMTLNVRPGGELGSVNWLDASASSLSELGVGLSDAIDKKLMDGQIATAFLTGIVAETDRFSNQKTSPQTMSISAELMAAGANQQLVATKLEEPAPTPPPAPAQPIAQKEGQEGSQPMAAEAPVPPKPDDGTIEIEHENVEPKIAPEAPEEPTEPEAPQIHIDEQGDLHPFGPPAPAESQELPQPQVQSEFDHPKPTADNLSAEPSLPPIEKLPEIKRDEGSHLLTGPEPVFGAPMTANSQPDMEDEPSSDPLSVPSVGLLNREPLPSQKAETSHDQPMLPAPTAQPELLPDAGLPQDLSQPVQPAPNVVTPTMSAGPTKTLSEIEKDVNSPHMDDDDNPSSIPPQPMMPPVVQPSFTPNNNPAPAAPSFQMPAQNQPAFSQPANNPAPTPATSVDEARNAVEQALGGGSTPNPGTPSALNAMEMTGELHQPQPANNPAPAPLGSPQPIQQDLANLQLPQQPASYEPPVNEQTGPAAPPVPPPMMPGSFPPQQ